MCFKCVDDKAIIVSWSYLLRHHDQFNQIFVAPDRIKLNHAKLVTELKERRSKGEDGIIIKMDR